MFWPYLSYSLCLLSLLGSCSTLFSQSDSTQKMNTSLGVELSGGAGIGGQTPFWMRANQYGIIPSKLPFGLLKVEGKVILGKTLRKPQWEFEGEVVSQIGPKPKVLLSVGAAVFKNRGLEIYIGRRKEVIGLGDTLMSSGFYGWSGNALPLPKVHIGTAGFLPLGFTKKFVSVQATFAHGWFGKAQFAQDFFLHQKTLYLRLGKPQAKTHFYIGGSHFAQWGGKTTVNIGTISGINGQLPSSFYDYLLVLTAKKKPNSSTLTWFDIENRVGNHIGSFDIMLTLSRAKSYFKLYMQHAIENAPNVWSNFPDGLYGVSWQNLGESSNDEKKLKIQRLTFETLYTLNQGIFFDSKWGYLYNDYFNNSQYTDGWAYRNHIIGTPLITLRTETQSEWFDSRAKYSDGGYYQINGNSLRSAYIGLQAGWGDCTQLKMRLNASEYFIYIGGTNKYGQSVSQLSGLIEVKQKMSFWSNMFLKFEFAFDHGKWLTNTSGIRLSLRKVFAS